MGKSRVMPQRRHTRGKFKFIDSWDSLCVRVSAAWEGFDSVVPAPREVELLIALASEYFRASDILAWVFNPLA